VFSKKGEHEMRRRKVMEIKSIKSKDAYQKYLIAKKAEGLSEQTLDTYRLHIDHFMENFGNYFNTAQLSEEMYNHEVLELQEDENKRDVTVTSYCRSIRAFFYWMQDKGYMEQCSLALPKFEKRIKEIYTDEEISLLLKKPAKGCSEVEYQTWVFINFTMATGLRLSSILDLKVSDYLAKDSIIYIQHTKQKLGQKMQINKELCSILNRYIEQFELTNENYLFCIATGERMAKRTMQDNVATYNRARDVQKTSIHLMRHTFAVNYYTKTKDILALKNILGHSQLSTTEHYLQSLGLTIQVSDAYNPQLLYIQNENTKKKRRGKL